MSLLTQDVRHALRALGRSRGFTLVAVLTLALGIGANAAIFSILDAVLLQPLPYPEPERLVMLWTDSPSTGLREGRSSYANVRDWMRHSQSFEELALFDPASTTLTGEGPAEQVSTTWTTASLFSVLGVPPLLGRTFTEEEDGAGESLVVISHGLWERRFGASPRVLEQSLEVDGRSARVVGVMPPGFGGGGTDLWEPHSLVPGFAAQRARRGIDSWMVMGRLEEGVSLDAARAELNGIGARLADEHPRRNAGLGISVVPLDEQVTGETLRTTLWMLFGAVVLVLLIGCTNVASLFLARSVGREREMAVRAALGAQRGHILRQLLVEAGVLSLIAGGVAVVLAALVIDVVPTFAPGDIPRLEEIRLDGRVLAFTFAASLLVGLLFGLAPAWQASRSDPQLALRKGSRGAVAGRRRAGEVLVVAEFALALVLATGAGLLVRSLVNARSVEPGYRSGDVLMMQMQVPRSRTDQQRVSLYREAVASLEAIPGVEAAGAINDFFIPLRPDQTIFVDQAQGPSRNEGRFVAPITSESVVGRYFDAVGLPLLGGRTFSDFDTAEAQPVAVINETMAQRFWPGGRAVGGRFLAGPAELPAAGVGELPWITVVGVVGDARRQGLETEPIPQIYRPHAQDPSRLMSLLVRSDSDPGAVAAAARLRIGEIDPSAPLYHVTTVAQRLRQSLARRRFQSGLLAAFAALALVLAATGIYGLMHQSVSRRTQEIGVRMALGAHGGSVLGMVLKRALGLATLGVAVGAFFALALSSTLSSLLFQVKPTDPIAFGAGAASLVCVAIVACYFPARRATRIDPIAALREE